MKEKIILIAAADVGRTTAQFLAQKKVNAEVVENIPFRDYTPLVSTIDYATQFTPPEMRQERRKRDREKFKK